MQIYVNKIKYRIVFEIKTDVDQDKDGENEPEFESVEVLLVHCNLGQLINTVPHLLAMLDTTNTEFPSIVVWFTDKNSKQLEIGDNVGIIK